MSRAVGQLLAEYLSLRKKLESGLATGAKRRVAERQLETLRRRLLINYSPLVKHVAGRTSARTIGSIDQEDLFSWGLLGLLGAIESYDPKYQTRFESYAISKIRWSILDELRKVDPLPRRMRARAQEVERTRDALAQRIGRPPTEEEVAHELGVGTKEHRAFLQLYSRTQVASFESHPQVDVSSGATIHELVEDTLGIDPATEAEVDEVRSRLAEAIENLGERERLILTFYFHEGLTLREIGKALGLTEGRISQILGRALTKLRDFLSGTWMDPDNSSPNCSHTA